MIVARQEGAILRLAINRPEKKNALTPEMYGALQQAFERANADRNTSVILIEGQPGIFCAGNDISTFVQAAESGDLGPVLEFLRVLAVSKLPIVAAVDGPAIGIGTTLLLHCDQVFASDRSVFAAPFVDLGLVPEAASSLIAPLLMGHQQAFRLLAMGDRFTALEAMQAGFVSQIVAAEDVAAKAMSLATRLALKPRESLLAARALLRGDTSAILARIEEEGALFAARLRSAEAQAAFKAFLAKGSS